MQINPTAGYNPHPKQRDFHRAWPLPNAEFTIAAAGTRGGKTYGGMREFIKRIVYEYMHKRRTVFDPLHYWVCAPDYKQTKVAQKELFNILGGINGPLVTNWLRGERELRLFGGHVLVEFKTTKNPESLVAVGLDGLYYDEAAKGKEESWLGGLYERLADRDGWAIFTTTPMGRNWFWDEIVEKAIDGTPGYNLFKWHTVDNIHSPALQRRVAKAKAELPYTYFKREYEASFDAFIGQIYSEWDETIHIVREDPVNVIETRYGVDWGFGEGHPGVIVALQKDSLGIWTMVDEISAEGRLEDWWIEQAKILRKKWGDGKFIADPSRPDRVRGFKREGLGAQNANNEVNAGIETVAKLLHPVEGKTPTLRIHARNKRTMKTLPAYRWDDRAKDERPVKENDDEPDALRYALHTKPHKPWAA